MRCRFTDTQFTRYAQITMPNAVVLEILEPGEAVRQLYHAPIVSITVDDLAQARRISDRAIFMLDGEIIEQASTEEIFMTSRCKLTRDFVSGQIG